MTAPRCEETVGEPPGYWHFHQCSARAKWRITTTDVRSGLPEHRLMCGTHKNRVARVDRQAVIEPLDSGGHSSER